MLKKLTLLAMSVAALVAFAVPAVAHGAEVTNSLGGEAEAIEAVSENTITITEGGGELNCDTVRLSGTGSSGHYAGTGTAEGGFFEPHKGECNSSLGAPILITSINWTVNLNTKKANFSYVYDITGGPSGCTFTAETNVTYAATSDQISIAGSMTGGGPLGCPKSGSISGDFTVTDEFGEPVVIH